MRQVALPGVSDKDLAAAIRFEIDSMNPTRRKTRCSIGRASAKVARSWWASRGAVRPGALHDAVCGSGRQGGVLHVLGAGDLFGAAPVFDAAGGRVSALLEEYGELEVYGESAARPMYSARLTDRPKKLAPWRWPSCAWLLGQNPRRCTPRSPNPEPPHRNTTCRRIVSLCSRGIRRLSARPMAVNLLPREQRQTSSRMRLVPALALGVLLFAAADRYRLPENADPRYLAEAPGRNPKTGAARPQGRGVGSENSDHPQSRADVGYFSDRTKEDLEAMNEPPSCWLLPHGSGRCRSRAILRDFGRGGTGGGLAQNAGWLASVPWLGFSIPITRANGEMFSLRSPRQGVTP